MSFGQSIRSVLGQYATFSGRAGRAEFWWFQLFALIASVVGSIVDEILTVAVGFGLVGFLISFGLLLPSISVSVRRLHDIGRTGWWVLWLYLAGFVAVGLAVVGGISAAFSSGSESMAPWGAATLIVGSLGIVAVMVLWLVWMVTAGDPTPNRYGPPSRTSASQPLTYSPPEPPVPGEEPYRGQ